MEELEKVKPCPFCGNKSFRWITIRDQSSLTCDDCGCIGPIETEVVADKFPFENWNKRINEKGE